MRCFYFLLSFVCWRYKFSEAHLHMRVNSIDLEMTRAKRVRFSDPQVNPSWNRSTDANPLPCDVTKDPPGGLGISCNRSSDADPMPPDVIEDPPSNDVKTSEYAFFKKFKKDVTHYHQKRPLLKKNNRLGDSSLSNHLEVGKMPMMDLHSRMTGERATPNDAAPSSCTPLYVASMRSGVSRTSDGGHVSPIYPLPLSSRKIKDVNKIQSSTNSETPKLNDQNLIGSEISTPLTGRGRVELPSTSFNHEHDHINLQCDDPEVTHNGKDIFCMKRAKLQKWVKETLLSHNEEPSKRCDLVSLLLKRLLPESNEIKYPETLKSRQMERETEFHLPAVPKTISASSRNSAKFEELQNFDKRMFLKYKQSKVPSTFTGQEHSHPRRCRSLANGERTALLDCGPPQRQLLKYRSPNSQCCQLIDQSLMADIPGSIEAIYGHTNLLPYEGGDSRWNPHQGKASRLGMDVSFPSADYGNMNMLDYERRDHSWKSKQRAASISSPWFDSALEFPAANCGNVNLLEYERGDFRCRSNQGTTLNSSMGLDFALSFPSTDYGDVNLQEYEIGDSRWISNQRTSSSSSNSAHGFPSTGYGDINFIEYEKRDPRWNSNAQTVLSSSIGYDSALCLPSANYGYMKYEREDSGWIANQGTALSFSKDLGSALGFPSADYGSCSPEYGSSFHDFGHQKESRPLQLNWHGFPGTFCDKNQDAFCLPRLCMSELPSSGDHALERYNPEGKYPPSPLSCAYTPKQFILAEQYNNFNGFNDGSCFYLLPFSDKTGSLHQRNSPETPIENNISCSFMNDSAKEVHSGETAYHVLQLPSGEKYDGSHDLLDDVESDEERSGKQYTEEDCVMA